MSRLQKILQMLNKLTNDEFAHLEARIKEIRFERERKSMSEPLEKNETIPRVTYREEYTKCGKPNCKTCSKGPGHGPYWYSYQKLDDKVKKIYIGKSLKKLGLGPAKCSECNRPALEGTFLCPVHTVKM